MENKDYHEDHGFIDPLTWMDSATTEEVSGLIDGLDGLGGDLRAQTQSFLKLLESTEDYQNSAPVGFPIMFGSTGLTLLEWLDTSGTYTIAEQSKAFVQKLSHGNKMTKNVQKRIQRNWSVERGGSFETPEVRLTGSILHPEARLTIVTDLRTAAGWLQSPMSCFIKGAHRLLGWQAPMTCQQFVDAYLAWSAPEGLNQTYYAAELWEPDLHMSDDEFTNLSDDTTRELSNFAQAVLNFLHSLLIKATEWQSLSDQERNGILLGAHTAASLLQNKGLLMPFVSVIPNLARLMDVEGVNSLGLANSAGEPTAVVDLALFTVRMREAYTADSEYDFGIKMISPLSRHLDKILDNPTQVRQELLEFRTAYLTKFVVQLSDHGGKLYGHVDKLTPECEPILREFLRSTQAWFCEMGLDYNPKTDEVTYVQLDPTNRPEETSLLREMWQKKFLDLINAVTSKSVDELMADLDLDELDDYKKRAEKAISEMDTTALTTIASALEEKKEEVLFKLREHTNLLLITDELHDEISTKVEGLLPPESLSDTDILSAESAKDDEIKELKQLGELQDQYEVSLKEEVKELRAQLHDKNRSNDAVSLANKEDPPKVAPVLLRLLSGDGTLKDTLDVVNVLYPDTAQVLPSAYESIVGCGYKNIGKVMEALIKLCGDYYTAIMIKKQADSTARLTLGSLYKAGESDTTMANPKLAAMRNFRVDTATNSTDYSFTQHLTLGAKRGEQTCLQVHFRIIDGIMLIARVGSHLETASS